MLSTLLLLAARNEDRVLHRLLCACDPNLAIVSRGLFCDGGG